MGFLDKIKKMFFGKHGEKEVKAGPEPPMRERQTIVYEEEEPSEAPEIDEYVDIELTSPAKKTQGRIPMEGTTMVKKKATKKKPAKKAVKKKATKKVTKKKPAKKKATKKK